MDHDGRISRNIASKTISYFPSDIISLIGNTSIFRWFVSMLFLSVKNLVKKVVVRF